MDNKIKYLNDVFVLNKTNPPKLLYKYKTYDKHLFDMLENNYLFCCVAKKLDDESECDVEISDKDIYAIQNDLLNYDFVNFIVDNYIAKHTSKDNLETIKSIVNDCVQNGKVSASRFLDCSFDLEDYLPKEQITELVNIMANLNDSLANTSNNQAFNDSIALMLHAKENIGVCSLASRGDNEKLWENYSDNYNGCCIEFDLTNYDYKWLLPVLYKEDRNKNLIQMIVGMTLGKLLFKITHGEIKEDTTQVFQLLLTKDPKWSYQEEWRIIADKNEKIPMPKINKILIGHNTESSNLNKLIKCCNKNNIDYEIV